MAEDEVETFFNNSSDENEPANPDSDNEDDEEDDNIAATQTPRDRLREIGETFELPNSGLIRPERELHSMRLPRFLHIKEKGFSTENFTSLEHTTEQTRLRKLNKVRNAQENTIRWRYKPSPNEDNDNDEEAIPVRQSNTRIVEWDDGSMHLFVGKKSFEIVKRKSTFSNAFPYVVHSSEMECHGAVTSTISLKPSKGFDDENHRMVALQVKKASAKRSKIMTLEQTVNMRKLLRRRRAEAQRAVNQAKAGGGGAKKKKGDRRTGEGSDSEGPMDMYELDEAGDEYDNEFIAAEDDYGEYAEPGARRSRRKKKRLRPTPAPAAAADGSTSSDAGGGGDVAFTSSDSEAEVKRKAPSRRTRVIEDDSDSD